MALAALMAFILTILDDDKSKGCFTSGLFTSLGMYGAISGLKAILNKVLKEGILNGFGFADVLYGLGNDFEDCVL